MKKRKLAIFILAIVALSAAIGGVVAAWVTGARLEGAQITTGSISLDISDTTGGSIPMSKQLNWVDVDYNIADYDTLNVWASENKVAKANFSVKNTSEKDLNIALTFDTTNYKYSNPEGVEDSIVAWLYVDGNTIVDGLRFAQLTSTYKYTSAFTASEKRDYTLFMATPSELMNGFAADKSYKFDIVATGTLGEAEPAELVALKVDASKALKTVYEIGETFTHEGIVVTAVYSDGSSVELNEGYTVSTPDMSKPGIKTVTVSYEGMEATYNIMVQYVKFTGESLKLLAKDADYTGGNLQGGNSYLGGLSAGNTISYTIDSAEDFSNVAVYLRIYGGKWQNNGFNAVSQKAFSISVNGIPVDTYDWDPANNHQNDPGDFCIDDRLNLKQGENVITITINVTNEINFYHMRLEYTGDVEQPTLDHIEVNADEAKKDYYVGDTFSADGIVVKAYYSDKEPQVIESGYTVSTPDMTVGIKTITVTYQGKTATYEITVSFVDEYNGEEIKLEAELADRQGSCNVQETMGSGGAFVGNIANGDKLTFVFKSNVEQYVKLYLAISHGNDGLAGAFDVYVNGDKVSSFDAENSGDWYTIKEFPVCSVKLVAGVNVIVLDAINTQTNVNVDYLKIAPDNGEDLPTYDGVNTLTLKAEDATLEGGCKAGNRSGSPSGKAVGNMTSGSRILFKFNSTGELLVELHLTIASNADINNFVTVHVGQQVLSLDVIATGDRVSGNNTFKDFIVGYATLPAGVNDVEVRAANITTANYIYCLDIVPVISYNGVDSKYGVRSATYENCQLEYSDQRFEGANIGYTGSDTVITYSIYSTSKQNVELRLSIAGGDSAKDEAFEVLVNGVLLGKYNVKQDNWSNYSEILAGFVQLSEGYNTIVIKAINAGFNFEYLRIVPDYAAATGADLIVEDGRVYFIVSGAYVGEDTVWLEEILRAIHFDLQQNGMVVDSNDNWTHFTKLPIDAYKVAFDEGTWKIYYDVTDMATFAYNAHFRGSLEDTNTADVKLALDKAQDGKTVVVNGRRYILINRYGQNDVFNYWGCVGLRIMNENDPIFTTTDVDLVNEGDTVYLVIKGSSSNYTKEALEEVLRNVAFDLQHNQSAGAASWDTVADFVKTLVVSGDGNWELKINLMDLAQSSYTVHFNGRDLMIDKPDIDGKFFVVGGNSYVIINKYSEDGARNDGALFFGAIGIVVGGSSMIKPISARVVEEDNKVYLALEVYVIGYEFNNVTLVNEEVVINLEKREDKNSLYSFYFDISDLEGEFWCHLYFDESPFDADKGDFKAGGSMSLNAANGKTYTFERRDDTFWVLKITVS